MPGALDIEVERDGNQRKVVLRGELDVVTAPHLRETLLELITGGASAIDIDMAKLSLIDSTGLGVLVGVLKRSLQHDCSLRLCSPQRGAKRVLDITGLDRVFTIVD
jgi:anti-sigma B factor antagonist